MLHSKFKTPVKYTTEKIVEIGNKIKEMTRRLKKTIENNNGKNRQADLAREKYFDKFRKA